jgi:hypothetical protein
MRLELLAKKRDEARDRLEMALGLERTPVHSERGHNASGLGTTKIMKVLKTIKGEVYGLPIHLFGFPAKRDTDN